jgi:hypothetical protein
MITGDAFEYLSWIIIAEFVIILIFIGARLI